MSIISLLGDLILCNAGRDVGETGAETVEGLLLDVGRDEAAEPG